MLIIFIIIIIVLLAILLFYPIKNEHFNNNLELNNIKRITKEVSIYRPVESNNLLKVKKFIMNELNILGLDVKEQSFVRNIRGTDYNFSNIIATNNLVDDNYIILGCHIDAPQLNIEATTDAATCVGLIIEITKKLLLNNKKFPIMIVFFDGEEAIGGYWADDNTLSGSNYFVKNFNKNILLLMFDLIGGDINKNKIIHFNDNKNSNYMKQLADINKKYPKQIFLDPTTNISTNTSNIIVLNDYTPFANKYLDLKGLNLIPATFPDNHHTVNDNYNNVNWEYVDIFSNVIYEFLSSY